MSGNQHNVISPDNTHSKEFQFNTIEEAVKDIRLGKLVIVVDDEDRENEGDFITTARNATPEVINFMTKEGRGVVCVALTEDRCEELKLDLMVGENTALHQTPFTVSVDLKGHGVTTGTSAFDRSKTVLSLINEKTEADDLARPGHIFPLKALKGGVLRRTGHTEATVDLARLAGAEPAGVLVEIMNDDGSMARLPELIKVSKKYDLKLISIKDLIQYRLKHETLIKKEVVVDMPTDWGHFKLHAYSQLNSDYVHLALVKGHWNPGDPVLVRVHSCCLTGDVFGSLRCDCGGQLHDAMAMVEREGNGVVIYMNQEGRGIGLLNKLRAYELQEKGMDTVDANLHLGFGMDDRDYGVGAQILRDLDVHKIRLMTNNPKKRAGLKGYELEIVENVPIEQASNQYNEKYLRTKRDRMGHEIMK